MAVFISSRELTSSRTLILRGGVVLSNSNIDIPLQYNSTHTPLTDTCFCLKCWLLVLLVFKQKFNFHVLIFELVCIGLSFPASFSFSSYKTPFEHSSVIRSPEDTISLGCCEQHHREQRPGGCDGASSASIRPTEEYRQGFAVSG